MEVFCGRVFEILFCLGYVSSTVITLMTLDLRFRLRSETLTPHRICSFSLEHSISVKVEYIALFFRFLKRIRI